MFPKLATAILLAVSAANALTVNTPSNVVQCQPIQLTWDATGATAPFILSVQNGNDPSGPAIFTWTGLTGTSFTWPSVTVAGGTSLSLLIRDANGLSQQSAPFPVQTSTDSACLNGSSSGGSSSVGGSTPPGSSTTIPITSPSTVPSTTPSSTPVSSSSSRPSGSSSGSSSRPPATTSATGGNSGGASVNAAAMGVAGVVGAVVAAVLA